MPVVVCHVRYTARVSNRVVIWTPWRRAIERSSAVRHVSIALVGARLYLLPTDNKEDGGFKLRSKSSDPTCEKRCGQLEIMSI